MSRRRSRRRRGPHRARPARGQQPAGARRRSLRLAGDARRARRDRLRRLAGHGVRTQWAERRRAAAVSALCEAPGRRWPLPPVPRPEYPRPQFRRDAWLNLNGHWQFESDRADTGLERGLRDRELTGEIVVPFCPESTLSGVGDTDFHNAVWYRRTVDVPAEWAGQRVLLHFQAVDHDTTVWVDGVEVGRHRGGFTPFSCDLGRRTGRLTIVVYGRGTPSRSRSRGASSHGGTATTAASTPAPPGSGRRCGWSRCPTCTCGAPGSPRTSPPAPSTSSSRSPPTGPAGPCGPPSPTPTVPRWPPPPSAPTSISRRGSPWPCRPASSAAGSRATRTCTP